MRYIILLVFILVTCSVFAQPINKYPILVKELNEAFQDNFIRGEKFHTSFTVDSLGGFRSWDGGNVDREKELLSVLHSSKEHLPVGSYFVHIYWDLYSDQVYSVVVKSIGEEGFPNYDLYSASPSSGYRNYIKTFKADITKELGSADSLNLQKWYINQWYKDIEIFVDKQGVATYLSSNPIVTIVDSTKRIKWRPSLYYGKLRNSIMSFNLSYENFVDVDKTDMDWISNVFVLDHTFKDQLVRFEEEPREIPYRKAVVSFVLNTLTDRFENPFIHQGDLDLGNELIHWIQKYDFDDLAFYWGNYPEAKRVYFYIKG